MEIPRHDKRANHYRADTEASYAPADNTCPWCVRNEGTTTADSTAKRQLHYLQLAGTQDVQILEEHLNSYLSRWFAGDRARVQERIKSILIWVNDEIRQWSGQAHPETGAPLSWWEARNMTHTSNVTDPLTRREDLEDKEHPDATWKHTYTGSLPAREIGATLEALLAPHTKHPWARGHMILIETGVNRPGRGHEAAAMCRRFAQRWSQDEDAWEREAYLWEAEDKSPCIFDREPGEEG